MAFKDSRMKSLNESAYEERHVNRDKELLDLNLRLLVAQHGKKGVADALSSIDEVSLTVIGDKIDAYARRNKRRTPNRQPKKTIQEMIRAAKPDSEAECIIERLAQCYENKEFLPELRDVRQFLESRSMSSAKARSRADALPLVIGVLVHFGLEELHSLERKQEARGSDLGIISDQILGQIDK